MAIISRYKLMRGLLKRRTIRKIVWDVIRTIKRRELTEFQEKLSTIDNQSAFNETKPSAESIVSALELEGAVRGPTLPNKYVEYLIDFAKRTPCYADRVPAKGFYLHDRQLAEQKLGKKLLLAQYFNLHKDALIEKLSRDPFLLSVAAKYLQAPPQLMSINMWWTFPVEASQEDKAKHAHVFHYDLDDVKFVKFFFYLTDVDEGAGPHVYVKGSNKNIKYKNSLFKSKRFTDQEIRDAYGDENIIHVLGKAGSCLIEDTITLHKGITPTESSRLILQFEYSINTYAEISCITNESECKIFV
ncbi:phytanoyl-CoA dioxygenase family protein [Pseudomonas sp. yb_1]|uniref:Phytanoyl-CoA dioxygenase n=1 Tax=Pseudomonas putida TaxID=303 RepID=A0A2S3XEC9_PSEPU|nr:phytanoyl-CoA dioxygenase family protein [Pseudomonas putida]POG13948.1 hypothetical protein BGP82_05825 [Pseudomonas putida]